MRRATRETASMPNQDRHHPAEGSGGLGRYPIVEATGASNRPHILSTHGERQQPDYGALAMAVSIKEHREQSSRQVRASCRILDPKLRAHARRYVIQCVVATAAVFVVLSVLDAFRQTVLVAALGASAFIAFAMPRVNAARPRYLLGGYVVGIVVGCTASSISELVTGYLPQALEGVVPLAFAALATGLAMFIMVVTDTEHPPEGSPSNPLWRGTRTSGQRYYSSLWRTHGEHVV